MSKIRVLGTNGSRTSNLDTTCILISEHTLIDAGSLMSTIDDGINIEHIFLTHSHLDHIIDIPFYCDHTLQSRKTPLNIYGSEECLKTLKEHIFNWKIWPDFEQITDQCNLFSKINFIPIKEGEPISVDGVIVTPFCANHTVATFGYVVKKKNCSFLYTGDSTKNNKIWDLINNDKSIKTLMIDISFPSVNQQIADDSKHFSPNSLLEDMKNLQRTDLVFFATHTKPSSMVELYMELKNINFPICFGGILQDVDFIDIEKGQIQPSERFLIKKSLKSLNKIGIKLSENVNFDDFFDFFTDEIITLTNADAATLYIKDRQTNSLKFKSVKNRTLNLSQKASQINWQDLMLFDKNNNENLNMMATMSALRKRAIYIDNVYTSHQFDFSGTKKFDEKTGYRTISMVCIPLLDHEQEVIGVLQLLNKLSPNGNIIPFDQSDKDLIQSLGSQIAIKLAHSMLINEFENLFRSLLDAITYALKEKSPHTYTHIINVNNLCDMFINEINKNEDVFEDKNFNEFKKLLINTAAQLHDIGKLSTPEYILNKANKLEKIIDRIEIIEERFKRAKKCNLVKMYEDIFSDPKNEAIIKEKFLQQNKQIDEDLEFLKQLNKPQESIEESKIYKLSQIAKKSFFDDEEEVKFLTENEFINLSVQRGSITDTERYIINNHASVSTKILQKLPFPKKYETIKDIASNHHEKLNGTGYPRGLKDDEISFESRILAIIDIFEAITSSARPYKKPNTLSTSFKIIVDMAKNGQLDKDLVKFLYTSELYLKYAHRYLLPSQIDEVSSDIFKDL